MLTHSPKPTASELEILHVLWERGPSTVREVHQALSDKRPIGYTSVLKLMQIMTAKGTLRRNEEQRAHVYEAVQPAEKTKRQLALDVLQRVFDGSASQLMMHALADRKASKEEVDELRRLLNDYEETAMTHFADWLSPATLRLLALALLHFLWQGAALAALAYVLMALCRSAATRYAIAVAMLILMVSAPATTFLVLHALEKAEAPASTAEGVVISPGPTVSFAPGADIPRSIPREAPPDYFLWLVEAWFAGVMLLSLRSAGGFLVVARLRRRESTPLNEELLELCLSLERRMGLTRVVRYCQCMHLDAPAVAGWVRPLVFLPMTALTGLSAAQLEAVIAHELAHIRRFDAFVNLFQIAVETLLFYHPAVWWLGKEIRVERENCCDDEAVALCGSPVNYAKALAHMAEWQAAPRLVMAANRGLLSARVARLLGANENAGTFRRASLSAGVLCLSAALLAGSAFVGGAHNVHAQSHGQVITQLSAATPSPTPAVRKPLPTPLRDAAVLVSAPNANFVQETNPAAARPVSAQQP